MTAGYKPFRIIDMPKEIDKIKRRHESKFDESNRIARRIG